MKRTLFFVVGLVLLLFLGGCTEDLGTNKASFDMTGKIESRVIQRNGNATLGTLKVISTEQNPSYTAAYVRVTDKTKVLMGTSKIPFSDLRRNMIVSIVFDPNTIKESYPVQVDGVKIVVK